MPKNYSDSKESVYHKSLAIRENFFGLDHPSVAQNLHDLALILKMQGRYDEAEPLYLRALDIREKVLGSEHPDVSQNLNNLASLLYARGQFSKAEPLYRRALAIREKVFGLENPYTITSLHNLAGVLKARGKYEEAESLYLTVLDIQEKLLGPEHPDLLRTLSGLISLLEAQEEQGEGSNARLQHKVLNLREKLPEYDPEKVLQEPRPSVLNRLVALKNFYASVLVPALTPERRRFFLLVAFYPLTLLLAELLTAGFGWGICPGYGCMPLFS